MPKRRNYSADFKHDAAALANQPGITKAQIGRELHRHIEVFQEITYDVMKGTYSVVLRHITSA